MSATHDPVGLAGPEAGSGEYNTLHFLVASILNKANTATLVQIVSCTNEDGVEPVGWVDVHPLINQMDGNGNPTAHGTVHHIPYFRIQGGRNAVIIDPEVGDIGIAIFADHDISVAANTRAQANPGTQRRFDMADGMYLGGVRNSSPTQYLQFISASMPGGPAINLILPRGNITISTLEDGDINLSIEKVGNINITTAKNDINQLAKIGNVNITAQVGNISMAAPAGDINLAGANINMTGTVNQSGGTMNVETDMIVAGMSTVSHVHGGVSTGTADTLKMSG
jgi:hypothetical protein